jgi:hypothetical protein
MRNIYRRNVLTQFKPEIEGRFGIPVNMTEYVRLTPSEPTDHGDCEVCEEQEGSFQAHFKPLVQATEKRREECQRGVTKSER